MHAHLQYIFWKLLGTKISLSFHPSLEDPLGGILFALTHFHTLHPFIVALLTCVFPLLENNTHIVGLALNMLIVFLWLQN